MPNPVWPETLFPAGMELRLQKSGSQLKSPFTGSLQACDYIGERWEVNIQLHGEGRTRVNSSLLESLLMRLSGGVNQIDIYHWRRPVPRGTLRGSPTIQVATVRGDTQLSLTVTAGSTLEAGDLIGAGIVGAGFQIFMCRTACAAVGTTLTVPLVNRVRGVILPNTAVVWDRPLLPVVSPEMSAGLSYRPGQTLPAEFQLVEFPTINTTVHYENETPGAASLVFTGRAPTSITPWTPVFDAALSGWWDDRDLSDGLAASWTSRDASAQTVVQVTEASKPTKGATGLVFDGGDSMSLTVAATLVTGTTVPDGSGAAAGKGFTCTGLARATDGSWWVGNHGKALASSPTYAPSLVHLSADFTTILSEIILAPLYAGIQSVQGVAYDLSDDTLWFADLFNKTIRHISTAGSPLSGDITLTYTPNGIARDHAADALWINTEGSDPSPNVVEKRSCVDGSLISTQNISLADHDQFFYDDATRTLLYSFGGTGTIYTYIDVANTLRPQSSLVVLTADAIEGIALVGNTLYVANDGYFHSGSPALNRVLTYKVRPASANIIDIWGVVTVPATTGTDAIFTVGNSIASAGRGWSLYVPNTTTLRLIAHTGGTGTTTQAVLDGTSPALTSPRIFFGRFDITADAMTLWVDGTQIATGSAAVLDGALTSWETLRIGQGSASTPPTMTLKAIGYGMGQCDRQKTEGYLAHTFALSANLPSGHPYKSAPP